VPVQREHSILLALTLGLFDTLCISFAFGVATFLTSPHQGTFVDHLVNRLPYLLVVVVVWCTAAIDQRLFVSRRSETLLSQLFAATKAVFLSLLFSVFLLALFSRQDIDRSFVLCFGICMLLFILFYKLLVRLSLWDLRRRGYNYRRILIVGTNIRTAHLVEVIQSHEQYGYHIEGFLEDDPERAGLLEKHNLPYLGPIKVLEDLLVNRVIDSVYISLPVRSFYETIEHITHLCEGVGVPVRLLADLFPLRIARSDVMRLKNIPLLSLSNIPEMHTEFALKRTTDLVVSSILLLLLSPILLVIALLVKMDSRGPVFAREERLSRDNRRFHLLRFRTTDGPLPAVLRQEPSAEGEVVSPKGAGTGPPTRMGRLLRRYDLDELPQLINVWRGQISLVDPRPLPSFEIPAPR
jgi:lipopolysaccharide/colanic/teichoic acid biosynthesis glycosyltransferase